MDKRFSRTQRLLGQENMDRLANARVAVFGVGGVGGYVVEALARSGVGALDLIDNDTVALSNLNRQIIATEDTIGQYKVDAAEKRVHSINPSCQVKTYRCFYLPETADQFDFTQYDYVVDAIDTVTGKIGLVLQAQAAGTPIMSSMGAGNKLDPTAFEVADIYKTSVCPLAKVMRRELKKRGVKHLKVVYSKEEALTPIEEEAATDDIPNGNSADGNAADGNAGNGNAANGNAGNGNAGNGNAADGNAANGNAGNGNEAREKGETINSGSSRRSVPGSNAFVPSVAGLIIAGEVIKDLTVNRKPEKTDI